MASLLNRTEREHGGVNDAQPHVITQLLADIRGGRASRSDLLPLVYDDLLRQAHLLRRRRRSGGTLQTTALVHEAAARLLKESNTDWKDRAHFLAAAAQAMRQILADHARRRGSARRGAGWNRVALHEAVSPNDPGDTDLVALHQALEELSTLDERMGWIVACRFFAGMSVKEVAHVLSVSVSTVESEWRTARAWLACQLEAAGAA